LILAKKLGRFTEDWMAKEWLRMNLSGIWEDIEFCSQFTDNKLPDLHTYVIGKNLEKYRKVSEEQQQDLDFLPLSDTGRQNLDTMMYGLKDTLLELNRKLASVHKESKRDEPAAFDGAQIKAFARNTGEFVNGVLALTGSKAIPAERLEQQIYGYSITVIATIIVSAVAGAIPLLYAAENNDAVRKLLFGLLNNNVFKRILGTSFALGCSESIATFIGEIIGAAGKTFELTEGQLRTVRDNILDVANAMSGTEPAAGSGRNALVGAFDDLAHHWAFNPRHQERAASLSAERNWERQSRKSARTMRNESQEAREGLFGAIFDRNSRSSDDDEYDDDGDVKMKKGKGGKRTIKRRQVKRKRRTVKK